MPVVVCVVGMGVEGGARQEGDDGVAEKPGGVGLEFLFERVDDGLLVALFAEHAVERRENLDATAVAAVGTVAGAAADAGLENG